MRDLLIASFRAALAAVDPLRILPPHLPAPPKGRTLVVGAGKGAGAMALAVESHWPAHAPLAGMVTTRYGHGLPTQRIRVLEAGHPLPDGNGEAAAREMLDAARGLDTDDLLLCLVSGGASSLLTLPAPGLALADVRAVTQALLRCGAPIQDINTVRKHLSAMAGGQLAAATRARVLALIISDVTGNAPTHIGSGPCAPDPTTYADALAVLERYRVTTPSSVSMHLHRGASGALPETPKPADALFRRVANRVIATGHDMLLAATDFFQQYGITPLLLGDEVTGEASDVAATQAKLALQAQQESHMKRPLVLLSGGETTVTVRGNGKGGRNTAYLLALARALQGQAGIHAIACDTDGIDGTEDNAGAIIAPDTLARAQALGLDAAHYQKNDDSHGFFAALEDLLVTGPTRTNVNDYRAILVT